MNRTFYEWLEKVHGLGFRRRLHPKKVDGLIKHFGAHSFLPYSIELFVSSSKRSIAHIIADGLKPLGEVQFSVGHDFMISISKSFDEDPGKVHQIMLGTQNRAEIIGRTNICEYNQRISSG